jgi:hypothetical protein
VRGERGGQVLAADEATTEQHRRQRHLLLLRFVEGMFEVVTREHVTLDERLSESTGLAGEHRGSPAANCVWFRIGGRPKRLNPRAE